MMLAKQSRSSIRGAKCRRTVMFSSEGEESSPLWGAAEPFT